jgi:glyoxylase I family protein
MALEIQTIHHVGLIVKNLDRSIYFYHDILGLKFSNEPTGWFEGPALEVGVGVEGARLRQVTFWVDDQTNMELLEYSNREVDNPIPPNNALGAAHVCFKVPDIHAARAYLESHGVTFYSDVNVVDEGPLAGWRWCYFSDPDGLALELVEVAYYDKDLRDAQAAEYLRTRPPLESLDPLFP